VNLVRGLLEVTGGRIERIADAFAGTAPPRAGGTIALGGGTRWTMAWLHVPGLGDFAERVVAYGPDAIRALEFPAPYLRQAPTVLRRSRGRDGVNEVTLTRSWQEAYGRQLDHFHACVTDGEPCRTPAEDAVEDVRLLCAMLRTATTAQTAEAAA
jgi:predicted dehydrogenase